MYCFVQGTKANALPAYLMSWGLDFMDYGHFKKLVKKLKIIKKQKTPQACSKVLSWNSISNKYVGIV